MRDWLAEVDQWLERFRDEDEPPEVFARALEDGWSPGQREALADQAAAHEAESASMRTQLESGGVDLVRFDCKSGSCSVCVKYCGKAYSLTGETPELPPPPPATICPACRHVLNMLTPFFMQRTGVTLEDLVDDAQPFED